MRFVAEIVRPTSSAPGPVLQLDNVRKSYAVGTATETEVLHGIRLELRQGEFAALIGPSGSGKSTLLNLIGLLDRPTQGELRLLGTATSTLAEGALTRLRGSAIGFIFQHHHLLPEFSAIENVVIPMFAARGRRDAAMFATAGELLDRVGMAAFHNRRVTDLSGGQQQRVAVARALAMRPALVLADEPTGNLDTKSSDAVFALMRDVCNVSHTAFLIVTHDPRLAARCDRIIELVDGDILSDRPNKAETLP